MDKLLKQAKKFTAKKKTTRQVLKTILVNEEYVIATDSFWLFRAKHQEEVNEPYLVSYEDTDIELEAKYYPEMSEFIPNTDGSVQVPIHLKYWIDVHTEALVVAKYNPSNFVKLIGDTLITKSVDRNDISVEYRHDFISHDMSEINSTAYDCKLMLNALKVFRVLKEDPVLHWYGPMRPLVLKSENIEILIVPVRLD